MSKPIIRALLVGTAAAVVATVVPIHATAAELLSPAPVVHGRYHHAGCWCGRSYVRHRELLSTYGLGFDPRNFDQTEPYYHFGRMRTYPRYWVEADPVQ